MQSQVTVFLKEFAGLFFDVVRHNQTQLDVLGHK